MRSPFLAMGTIVLSCVFAGCGDSGESGVSLEEQQNNPNVGVDAMKKTLPPPSAKSASPSPAAKKK